MSQETLIKVENVSKKFCRDLKKSLWYGVKDIAGEISGRNNPVEELRPDEFWSVTDVSFELKRGECLGLIGPNGAGKSTLLKMFNGLIKPDKGRISIRGRVGALIELGAGFNPILTGRENIYVNGAVLGFTKKEIERKFDRIVEFAEIGEFIDTPVQNYSSGMKVRLGFAVAAQMEPEVLFIDEVLAVGDLNFAIKCLNAVGDIIKNAAVIFVSHSMQFVDRISTKVMVMEKGKVDYYGNDVGEGIDHYLAKFTNTIQKESGSGKARVNAVHIVSASHGPDKKDMVQLQWGDALDMEIDLVLQEPSADLEIRVVILNQAMVPVADCSSGFCGFQLSAEKMEQSISLSIPEIKFSAGLYSVAVAIMDQRTKEILTRRDGVESFQVLNSASVSTWAATIINGEWKEKS